MIQFSRMLNTSEVTLCLFSSIHVFTLRKGVKMELDIKMVPNVTA